MYSEAEKENLIDRTNNELNYLNNLYKFERNFLGDFYVEEMRIISDSELRASRTHSSFVSVENFSPKTFEVGAFYIFVSAFKMLDMVVEWIISDGALESGNMQYRDKIRQLESKNNIPQLFLTQPWLMDVAKKLFAHLFPYRNAVIHREKFGIKNGLLSINDNKGGVLEIDSRMMQNFSDFCASLVLLLSGKKEENNGEMVRLMKLSDQLAGWHGLDKFDKKINRQVQVSYFIRAERREQPIPWGRIIDLVSRSYYEQLDVELVVSLDDEGTEKSWRLSKDVLKNCHSEIDIGYVREFGCLEKCSNWAKAQFIKDKNNLIEPID